MNHKLFSTALVAALIGGATLSLAPIGAARAVAPVVKTSAPGYYRMMLGDFEVTALSDGTAEFPVDKLLTGTTPAKVNAALAKSFLKSPLETSGNAYVIHTGSKLILIDAGAGRIFRPTVGHLVASLRAAGYQPEQVDEVYLTHAHVDHVGGLMDGDKMVFPNATIYISKPEAEFWFGAKSKGNIPEKLKGFYEFADASVSPYIKAGKVKTFDYGQELFPGIMPLARPGHTPGHTFY